MTNSTIKISEVRVQCQNELVSWCFKPSQPQRILSGLRATFIKTYIVERTNKAAIRPVEQSEKEGSCWEDLHNTLERATKTETDMRTE